MTIRDHRNPYAREKKKKERANRMNAKVRIRIKHRRAIMPFNGRLV